MGNQTKLIFKVGKNGGLTMSFTGSAIEGMDKLDLSQAHPDYIVPQIRELSSPTGFVDVEFPGEGNVRHIAVFEQKLRA